MHKIKKGIKKKIKGKKGKDSELFTPEELEKYKKQKEEEQKAQQEEDQHEVPSEEEFNPDTQDSHSEDPPLEAASSTSGKEDWRNYFSATDTVLKETSVNLEHIKESSYFIVKKTEGAKHGEDTVPSAIPQSSATPPVSTPAKQWVDLHKGGIDDNLGEKEPQETTSAELIKESLKEEPKVERDIILKPIEDLPLVSAEDYADVFDTTYVDTVESGEIKLYYIPDSPTAEDLNEPDPFDTSNVDKVLEVKKPKKQKQAKQPKQPKQPKQQKLLPEKPQKKKNLVNLGGAVDVLTGKVPDSSATNRKEVKKEVNLLADFEETEGKADKSKEVNIEEQKHDEQSEEKCAVDEILFGEETECELLNELVISKPQSVLDLKVEISKDSKTVTDEDSTDNKVINDFEVTVLLDPLCAPIEIKSEKSASHYKDLVAEFDSIDKVVVVKPLVAESHAIDDNIKDEFDAEFAALAAESIAKEKEKAIDEFGALDDDDPFDTSSVNITLVDGGSQPSQQLKEIDKDPFDVDFASEILGDQKIFQKPSKGQPPRPTPPKLSPQHHEVDPFDTSVAEKVLPADPFDSVEGFSSLPETLKPQSKDQVLDSDDFDPFDTSAAECFGKTELKVLEGEFLRDITDQGKIVEESDFDFNPRESETCNKSAPVRPPSPACFLTLNEEASEGTILTPQAVNNQADDFDPFDTSIAEKVHIKSLEEELLRDSPVPLTTSDLAALLTIENISSSHISSISKKALAEDFDPFDTSIADLCETTVTKNKQAVLSEEGCINLNQGQNLELQFKPPRPSSPVCLLATTPLDEHPTLQPFSKGSDFEINKETEEFDPFDTSIAEQFGKTELKVLETELLTRSSENVEVHDDFDPRAGEEANILSPSALPPRPISPACLLTDISSEVDQQLPPLSPIPTNQSNNLKEIDPFDTSIANHLSKTEIKNLEIDLFSDIDKNQTNPVSNLNEFKSNQHPLGPPPPPQCLFATTPTDTNPPLQPFTFQPEPKEATTAEEIDPFDTSIADQFGKTELRALEETLLTQAESDQQISSENLPALQSQAAKNFELSSPPTINSLKVVNPESLFEISPSAETIPVLQPFSNTTPLTTEEVDPFDTSIANKFGQTELKVLESELLVDSGTKRNLSDDEFDPREEEFKVAKHASPTNFSKQNIFDTQEDLSKQSLPILKANPIPNFAEGDLDPFDTSIADNIGPGKEELKLLDKELLGTN